MLGIEGARNGAGAAPAATVMSLVAAMCAGADSIDDTDRLRHGAMPTAFGGVRAPSTLGTFLRSFTHGHVLQLHAVHRRLLGELARRAPLLPGTDQVAFIDIDSTHKRVFGRAKQGAQIGRFKGVRTLHPLPATICTPIARPVIAGVRLRRGKAADAWRQLFDTFHTPCLNRPTDHFRYPSVDRGLDRPEAAGNATDHDHSKNRYGRCRRWAMPECEQFSLLDSASTGAHVERDHIQASA